MRRVVNVWTQQAFLVRDQPGWAKTVLQARANAPSLPLTHKAETIHPALALATTWVVVAFFLCIMPCCCAVFGRMLLQMLERSP
jgi:hypothetical protein